jgi:hypothetical protein
MRPARLLALLIFYLCLGALMGYIWVQEQEYPVMSLPIRTRPPS